MLLVEQNARAGLAISHHGAVLDSGRVALAGPGPMLLDDPRVAELYLGGVPTDRSPAYDPGPVRTAREPRAAG